MLTGRLAVIGLGLIGGSFAKAVRSAGAVGRIAGFDDDPVQRQGALAGGVIDVACSSAEDAVRDASLVLVAVPVLATAAALRSVAPGLSAEAVITDVGSTKVSVMAAARDVFGAIPPKFVAGHPIAGTEKSGVAHSDPGLFRDRRVILTPHESQDDSAQALVAKLWQACGARVVTMHPERHDAIFAATSHLPHLLAFSFVDMLSQLEGADADVFPNAGGGFRDFTRIASSSPKMWHDILRANAAPVATLLDRQIRELQVLREMMVAEDWAGLQDVFERARSTRERHLGRIE